MKPPSEARLWVVWDLRPRRRVEERVRFEKDRREWKICHHKSCLISHSLLSFCGKILSIYLSICLSTILSVNISSLSLFSFYICSSLSLGFAYLWIQHTNTHSSAVCTNICYHWMPSFLSRFVFCFFCLCFWIKQRENMAGNTI